MSVGISSSQYGNINKIGSTPDGRTVYQVLDGRGTEAGRVSVANKDVDTFEKSNAVILETAPKIEQYMQKHSSPEDVVKRQKSSKICTGVGGFLGSAIPLFACRKMKTWKQILLASIGMIAGLAGGMFVGSTINNPPGMMKFAKAANDLKKLDIQQA